MIAAKNAEVIHRTMLPILVQPRKGGGRRDSSYEAGDSRKATLCRMYRFGGLSGLGKV